MLVWHFVMEHIAVRLKTLLDDELIAGVSKFLACFGNGSCWCGAPRSFVLRAH